MKKSYVLALGLLAIPLTAHSFSDGFKKHMTAVQSRVMLQGEKLGPNDMKTWWSKFDEEIIALLSSGKKTEEELNQGTLPVELSVTETRGTEVEDIELGKIGAKFHSLDQTGKLWLAILTNNMYSGSTPLPYSTVHFYKEVDGKFQKVGALEEMAGPWDKEKIQFSSVQFQSMGIEKGAIKFATFHTWPTKRDQKANRSQIIWEFKDAPKAKIIVPEVDWHKDASGNVVVGRGEAFDVP